MVMTNKPVRYMNPVEPRHDSSLTPFHAFGYTPAKSTAKKAVAGCESPKARGAEPHPARFAAFLFQNRLGGSNGRARALPVTLRVPRSLTPVRAAAQCESWSAVVHLARLEINMTQTTEPAPDINRLRSVITDMDALSQSGFSNISAMAKLAIHWLESPDKSKHTEVVAQALKMIWYRADDIENCINSEAENVGCNWQDPDDARRRSAQREIGCGHD